MLPEWSRAGLAIMRAVNPEGTFDIEWISMILECSVADLTRWNQFTAWYNLMMIKLIYMIKPLRKRYGPQDKTTVNFVPKDQIGWLVGPLV